jgi:hypothetical protein
MGIGQQAADHHRLARAELDRALAH